MEKFNYLIDDEISLESSSTSTKPGQGTGLVTV